MLVPVAIGARQVPLAVPVGGVALIAQHRPPGREPRIERARAGDHAAGLVGVQSGQHRRAGRRAVVGGGVVAQEADARARQARHVRRQRRRMAAGAEPARRPQLVDHDHEDVRLARAMVGTRRARAGRLGGGGRGGERPGAERRGRDRAPDPQTAAEERTTVDPLGRRGGSILVSVGLGHSPPVRMTPRGQTLREPAFAGGKV